MSRPGPYRLVVLRHGQSEWNAAGLFTGWENAHLTAQGEEEAARAGSLLAEHATAARWSTNWGPDMRPDAMGGQYLDPHAASVGSVLSALSRWSVLAWRGSPGDGGNSPAVLPDDQDRPVSEVDNLMRRTAQDETSQVAATA